MQALAQQQIVAAPVKVKPSQQQVIDQLHQQCQQNDTMVMLHGSDGSGKTTIAELFVEQASNYAECAFVTVNERSTPDRLRAQVLNQLFGTISLNDETLSRQIQRQAPLKHAVIVIDNGELLAESFLAECVAAVSQLSAVGQKVSIIIAADSRWAYQQKPAPHLRVQGPVMIEVQPLTKDEQMRFLQALLPERQRRLWNLDRIQQFLTTINGYPGEIQQRLQLALATQAQRYKDEPPTQPELNDTVVEEDNVSLSNGRKSPRRSNVKLSVIVLITVVISVIFVAYLNRTKLMDWYYSAVATPNDVEQQAPQATTQQPQQQAAATTKLPTFEPLTQQSLELMPEDLAISYRDALDDLNRVASADNDPRELNVGLVKSPKTSAQQQPETTPKVQVESPGKFQTAAVLATAPSRYGVQIAVISSEPLLNDFRSDYGIAETTKVYQRNDGRFVIVYGDFASLSTARAATAELPKAVQQLDPWAKSYAAMQSEIKSTVEE